MVSYGFYIAVADFQTVKVDESIRSFAQLYVNNEASWRGSHRREIMTHHQKAYSQVQLQSIQILPCIPIFQIRRNEPSHIHEFIEAKANEGYDMRMIETSPHAHLSSKLLKT